MNIQTKQQFGERLNEQNKEPHVEHHWKLLRKGEKVGEELKDVTPKYFSNIQQLHFLASYGLTFGYLESTLSDSPVSEGQERVLGWFSSRSLKEVSGSSAALLGFVLKVSLSPYKIYVLPSDKHWWHHAEIPASTLGRW